jgi:hypothetical protein
METAAKSTAVLGSGRSRRYLSEPLSAFLKTQQ